MTTEELTVRSEGLLITSPVPQSIDILSNGGVALSDEVSKELHAIEYDPCLAVMVLLDGPSGLPAPGGIQLNTEPITWLADNALKGISSKPAVTIHTAPKFSWTHSDSDAQPTFDAIWPVENKWIKSTPTEFQIHRWRYSKPKLCHPNRYVAPDVGATLVLAGDAFGGPKVEGPHSLAWSLRTGF